MLGSRSGIYSSSRTINNTFIGPAGITNLQAWYDGQDNTTIKNAANTTILNNDPIDIWQDKSSNGNNLIQTNNINRPLYKESGINNKPALFFDGINDAIKNINYKINSQVFTIVSVHNQIQVSGPIWSIANNSNLEKFFPNYGGFTYIPAGGIFNTSSWASATGLNLLTTFISIVIFDASTSTVKLITYNTANGIKNLIDVPITSDLTFNGGFGLGERTVGTVDYYNGYIGEIIVYNKAIDTTEINSIISFLKTKWNM